VGHHEGLAVLIRCVKYRMLGFVGATSDSSAPRNGTHPGQRLEGFWPSAKVKFGLGSVVGTGSLGSGQCKVLGAA
jgi:hypothetical protein